MLSFDFPILPRLFQMFRCLQIIQPVLLEGSRLQLSPPFCCSSKSFYSCLRLMVTEQLPSPVFTHNIFCKIRLFQFHMFSDSELIPVVGRQRFCLSSSFTQNYFGTHSITNYCCIKKHILYLEL